VAEILLQKTRANSALPVYEDLVARYRTAGDLALADEADLGTRLRPIGLSVKRAAQLRGMAAALVVEGEEVLREHIRALKIVPGLGAYAVRAIACFGSGQRVGIVDANVARIFRRVFSVISRDPRAVIYQHIADAVIDVAEEVRESNFGLLDIGAAICVRMPKCSICPFNEFCPRYEVDRSG
jgi:A/G-specific adenine glycosylase